MIASIILGLNLAGIVSLTDSIIFLYLCGALFVIADLFVISLGLLAFNGLLAMYVAYVLQSGNNMVMGIPIDWPFVFGVSFVEAALLIAALYLFIKARNKPVTTGIESMVGEDAVVVSWKDREGKIRFQGETWKATSSEPIACEAGDFVVIESVDNLNVTVKEKSEEKIGEKS